MSPSPALVRLQPLLALAATGVARGLPPVGWVALLLAGWAIVLVPIVLWGLRRLDRENLAWLLLPLLAVLASAGLWFLARHAPGRAGSTGARPHTVVRDP